MFSLMEEWRDLKAAVGWLGIALLAVVFLSLFIVMIGAGILFGQAQADTLTCYRLSDEPLCYIGGERVRCEKSGNGIYCPLQGDS